ncbi:MAG: hypothetical protein ACHRXM_06490 [Isosphaerales bacterium]
MLRVEVLEQRALLSAAVWTGAGGDGQWDNPLNWVVSTENGPVKEVPGVGDDATIGPDQGTITTGVAENIVNSLVCSSDLSVTGDLRILAGMTLDGTASVSVGGDLEAFGTATISGTATLSGGSIYCGGISRTGTTDGTGQIILGSEGGVLGAGTIGPGITVTGGNGTILAGVNEGTIVSSGGNVGVSVNVGVNEGTIVSSGGTLTLVGLTLTNEGTIEAAGGTVIVGADTSFSFTPGPGNSL